MNSNFEYFVNLVNVSRILQPNELRKEILSHPISFWDPDVFWDWKQKEENYRNFGQFIILSTRSLTGIESNDLPITLVSNLHLTIPWYCQNIAELSMLLLEEFAQKKVSQLAILLDEIDKTFDEHPDFSTRKQEIFNDFQKFQYSLTNLSFKSLSPNWIDHLCD